jgi:FKBP-type peptidyl-prolyl cis-trans isomerase FklB
MFVTNKTARNVRCACLVGLRALALAGAAAASAPALAADAGTAEAIGAAASAPANTAQLKSVKDKVSYATGVMTARNLLKNEVDFDLDLMVQGLKDGMAGGAIAMDEKELKKVLSSMQADMQRHLTNERLVKASINRENGVIFQKEFAKKPGAVTVPGGLIYRVIKNGDGDKPEETATVVVKFKGSLINGTPIDATPEGKTATIKVTEVMTGFREALKRMNAGSEWEVVVPPNMAYGSRGTPSIGPNETLVFQIELVAVVSQR